MAAELMTGLLAMPLIGGLLLLIADRRGARRWGYRAAVASLGVVTICATGLVFAGDGDVRMGSWVPGAGAMSLHAGGVGGYAVVVVSAAALAALVRQRGDEPASAAVAMVALAGACVALLSGHFLLRYVALEVVALCVAAVPLVERGGYEGGRRARFAYVLLRIGDAGLLTAILVLMDVSGTLDIGEALHMAEYMSDGQLAWVVAGMALAVWVKAGVWPLGIWKQAGHDLAPFTGIWLYDLLVPSLGLYLLYRVTPTIVLTGMLRWLLLGAAALSTVVGGLRLARRWRDVPTLWVGSVLGGLALCCATLGHGACVAALLLGGSVIQITLGLWADQSAERTSRIRELALPVPGAGLEHWLLDRLSWLHTALEDGLFESGGPRLWRSLGSTAGLVYRTIEQDGMERMLRVLSRGVIAGGHTMQHWHTGRLRANTAWVVLALLLAVAVLVTQGW